nr:MAG TPA: hypothetical protein [Caudoviricetes sp.]
MNERGEKRSFLPKKLLINFSVASNKFFGVY